jgi:hypothetical protein
VHEGERLWEYAVMVTDAAYPIEAIGQLSTATVPTVRMASDELKNQWGLSGFTTQDINRCQTTARACAGLQLVELVLPGSQPGRQVIEAITSRHTATRP